MFLLTTSTSITYSKESENGDESDGHTGHGTVYAFKLSDLEDAATW